MFQQKFCLKIFETCLLFYVGSQFQAVEMVFGGAKKISGGYEHPTSALYFPRLWIPYFCSLSI